MHQKETGRLSKKESQERASVMLTCLFATIILYMSFSITAHLILDLEKTDFNWHLREAMSLDRVDFIKKFAMGYYYLWHFMVKIVYKLHVPKGYSACVVTAGIATCYYLLVNQALKKCLKQVNEAVIPAVSFVFCTLGPLNIPWYDHRIYRAADSINVWHNPTQLIARPFMIAMFWMTIKLYQRLREDQWTDRVFRDRKEAVAYALLLAASVYAKPTSLQVLIPGLGMIMLIDLIRSRGKAFPFCLKLAAAFIPAVLVFAAFFVSNLFLQEGSGGIEFAFLDVWRHNSNSVPVSFFLFLAFPIFILIMDHRRFLHCLDGQLSLTMLLSGTAVKALLAEGGERRYHGNLAWGYQMGGIVFWFVALKEFIYLMTSRELPEREYKITAYVGWFLLTMHFLTGLIYFYRILTGNQQC